MTKLGIQMQEMDNEVALLASGPFAKKINPSSEDPFPQTKTIIRVFMDDDQSNNLIAQGRDGGVAWAEHVAPYMKPWVYAVEAWNEPAGKFLFNRPGRKLLTEATVGFMDVAHDRGWKVVVGNFSVGQPPLDAWWDFEYFIRRMGPKDILGLHEYNWPNIQKDTHMERGVLEGWYCLRYRKAIRILAGMGLRPNIFIGEAGLDKLLVGGEPGGWQVMPHPGNEADKRREYWNQLCWYDDRLMEDDQVVGAVPYIAAPSHPWETYIIDVPLATWMRDRAGNPVEPPTELPIEPPNQGGTMKIETTYKPGAHIVIGNYPEVGLSVGLKDPWGNTYISTTGAKVEHGPGGFEFLVPNPGTPYTITIAGEMWEFAHRTGTTEIVFVEGEAPEIPEEPEEPEEPLPPWLDPITDPEPSDDIVIPCSVAEDIIDRMQEIIVLLESVCEP